MNAYEKLMLRFKEALPNEAIDMDNEEWKIYKANEQDFIDARAMYYKEKSADIVNHPAHYTSGGIETIDYMEAKSTVEEFCGHLRLTTIKYLSRTGLKDDPLQDLEKAAWYLNKLIETRRKYGYN